MCLVSFLAGCLLLGSLILPKKSWMEEETKSKLGDSNDLYAILKFIGETYDFKFIMYNGAKLPPVSAFRHVRRIQ